MKKIALFFLLFSFSCFPSDRLSDLSTRVTDDGQVEMIYTLTSLDPTNTFPVFSINFTGEIPGQKPFALKTLEGAGKTGVHLGEGTYTSFWIAAIDCPKDDPNNINISVEAEEVSDEATYLCLNLKTFKMRYQNDPPNVKKNNCKTKELWLRRIEPGTFTMGSPEEETIEETFSGHETQHKITITKAYYIGIFETTQKQFQTIAGYNYSKHKGAKRPVEYVSYAMLRGRDKGANWPESHEVDDNCSYHLEIYKGYNRKKHESEYKIIDGEGPTFFHALRSKTGNTFLFDLPTEAHWEYACRAGTTTALNNGKNLTSICKCSEMDKLGRYRYNGGYDEKRDYDKAKTHTNVGSYLPNAWGLYDMHGNVYELCLDWYGDYSEMYPTGPASGRFRVIRGGSWLTIAYQCRSSCRNWKSPDGEYSASYDFGFRVALVQNNDVFYLPDDPIIPKIQKDFEFEISSETENTLPVFDVKLYGQFAGGLEYLLEEMGKVEYDGASSIVVGKGKHKLTWTPYDAYTNLVDEVKLRVEYEDVTEQATYLVLDLSSNRMRTSISEPDISDDTCRTDELWLRRIEPGTFTMGSPEDELGRINNETQHEVTLTKAYYIGIFEMTQKQFSYIKGWHFSRFLGDVRPAECPYDEIRGVKNGSLWPKNHEVDEQSFLGQFRKRAGNIIDLPTEAQWEYACRAGTTTALNNGKYLTKEKNCKNMAKVGRYWFNRRNGKDGYREHTKVGSYIPNAWGLYDMHGNVEEWCLDWYGDYSGDVTDPKGPTEGKEGRVLRGGSWDSLACYCRSAYRDWHYPGLSLNYSAGFRVVIVE